MFVLNTFLLNFLHPKNWLEFVEFLTFTRQESFSNYLSNCYNSVVNSFDTNPKNRLAFCLFFFRYNQGLYLGPFNFGTVILWEVSTETRAVSQDLGSNAGNWKRGRFYRCIILILTILVIKKMWERKCVCRAATKHTTPEFFVKKGRVCFGQLSDFRRDTSLV